MAEKITPSFSTEELKDGDYVLVQHTYGYNGQNSIITAARYYNGKCYTGLLKTSCPRIASPAPSGSNINKGNFINKISNVICKIDVSAIDTPVLNAIHQNLEANGIILNNNEISNSFNTHVKYVKCDYGDDAEDGDYVLCIDMVYSHPIALPAIVYRGKCYTGAWKRHYNDAIESGVIPKNETQALRPYYVMQDHAIMKIPYEKVPLADREGIKDHLKQKGINIEYSD